MTVNENTPESQGMIIDESKVIDRGGLGGKTISTTSTGSMRKQTFIPFCHVCGQKLGDDVAVCEICGNLCSSDCVVKFDGISRCLKCLQSRFSKRFFKVLICIYLSPKNIHKVTGIAKEEIMAVLVELLRNNVITYKGLIFHHLELTDKGREFVYLYSQVYKEKDVQEIDEWLAQYRMRRGLLRKILNGLMKLGKLSRE